MLNDMVTSQQISRPLNRPFHNVHPVLHTVSGPDSKDKTLFILETSSQVYFCPNTQNFLKFIILCPNLYYDKVRFPGRKQCVYYPARGVKCPNGDLPHHVYSRILFLRRYTDIFIFIGTFFHSSFSFQKPERCRVFQTTGNRKRKTTLKIQGINGRQLPHKT